MPKTTKLKLKSKPRGPRTYNQDTWPTLLRIGDSVQFSSGAKWTAEKNRFYDETGHSYYEAFYRLEELGTIKIGCTRHDPYEVAEYAGHLYHSHQGSFVCYKDMKSATRFARYLLSLERLIDLGARPYVKPRKSRRS